MSEDDKKFFDDSFKSMMPSKTKMAVLVAGSVLLNVAFFIGAVGVIAYAVKWAVSQ